MEGSFEIFMNESGIAFEEITKRKGLTNLKHYQIHNQIMMKHYI